MANKIVQLEAAGQPFIRIYIINNSRGLAQIETNIIFTKFELNDIKKRIEAKLEKSIILDHYDPILNTLVFYS